MSDDQEMNHLLTAALGLPYGSNADLKYLRAAREWIPNALDRIQAVRDLHRPIQVLGDCEAEDPDKCPGTHDNDYFFTLCSLESHGWACAACCYEDGHPREGCPHGWYHSDVPEHGACPTTKALNGDGA